MDETVTFDTDRQLYLESILSSLPYCVMIVDRNFRAIDCTAAALRAFGISRVEDLPDGAPEICVAESCRPLFRQTLTQAFAVAPGTPVDAIELQLEPPQGKKILVECLLAPLVNENGDVDVVMLSFQDISPLKTAEKKLEQAGSILESILKTIPDAMVVIDEEGIISSFSATAESMFGYDQVDVIGHNVRVLMPPTDRDAHDGYISRFVRTGEKRIIGIGRTVEGRRKDGTTFPLQLEVGEAKIGEERYFTGFMVDLTEKHETEAELQSLHADLAHASRLSAVGTLASSLAHEINQPLTAIANYLSAARDMMDGDLVENQGLLLEALQESVAESLRAGVIVRRLREFVSRGEINRRLLSIAQVVEDATVLGMVGAKEKGIQFSIDVEPDTNHVFVDRVQIQQVMVNLMRNAIEAMADSPRKELRIDVTSIEDDRVGIAVSDTGTGIDPEVVDRIFDPFASTKGDGMGLGLSICRTIIEAHGGTIGAEPNPGGGTIFRITLEKAKQEQEDDQ